MYEVHCRSSYLFTAHKWRLYSTYIFCSQVWRNVNMCKQGQIVYRKLYYCYSWLVAYTVYACTYVFFNIVVNFVYYLNLPSELYFRYPGTTTKVLNLGSYNYLGFAESGGPCVEDVVQRIQSDGVSSCSYRKDLGKIIVVLLMYMLTVEHLLTLIKLSAVWWFTCVTLRL